jgi:hypothetical protein
MMKKLLVLALVLAVAGLANAGLDLKTINGLDYSVAGNTITISSTLGVTGFAFALQTDNDSPLSGVVIPSGFGTVHDAGYMVGNVYDGISTSVGTSALVTGEILKINFAQGAKKIYFVYSPDAFFDISSISAGGASIALSTDTEGVQGSLYEMTIVPEPMTMLLLGLGGLFLRKK